jgi:Flp pilus assembly protein TadG
LSSRIARLASARGRRRPDARRGQALVEFAIVIPVLLLLLLGVVDFARAWNVYEVLTDAAREGAREAVVDNGKSEAEIRTIIQSAAGRAGIPLPDGDITITGMADGRGAPTTVRIQFVYRLKWVGAFLALAQGDRDLTLVTEAVMRNE